MLLQCKHRTHSTFIRNINDIIQQLETYERKKDKFTNLLRSCIVLTQSTARQMGSSTISFSLELNTNKKNTCVVHTLYN